MEISTKKLLNAVFFQIGWFACVFGGNQIAILTTLVVIIIHHLYFKTTNREWLVISCFACMGITIDSLLIQFNILQLTSSLIIPIWLVCLWILFSLTLCHSLQWFQRKPFLSAPIAALAGPWCYWVGTQFSDIQIAYLPISLLLLALIWSCLLPIGLFLAYSWVSSHNHLRNPTIATKYNHHKLKLNLLLPILIVDLAILFTITPNDSWANNTNLLDDISQVYAIGTAYNYEGSKVLYFESHSRLTHSQQNVRYYTPDGDMIAFKSLDYSKSLITPNFIQQNFWSKERIETNFKDKNLLMTIYSNNSFDLLEPYPKTNSHMQDIISKKKIISNNNLVIDAGFDHYIRENWDNLIAGIALSYKFAVPSRLTMISMRIYREDCLQQPNLQDSNNTICLTTKPKGLLTKFFLDPIYLTYEQQQRKLLRFHGLGNIADSKGDFLKVDIRYQYPNVSSN